MNAIVRELARTADAESPREQRARAAAEIIRGARGYRWVGIYDVGDEEMALIGYTGSTPPRHERFGIESGLSGEAVRKRASVVSNDVASDPRYLKAFESTGSETIVPILGAESGIVIGTLDAESDRAGAFSEDDVSFLEECAAVLRPLYD
ncbi:MAG: GAF domain-containing protein [Candidatus Cybelea sp.]